jgi:hypothetical protein
MRNGRRAIARGRRLPLFLDHHRGKSKVVAPRCAQGLPMTLSRLGQAKRTPHQSSHLARVVSFESRLRMTPRFSRNPPWEASDNASGKRQRIRKRRHQTQSLFREGDVFGVTPITTYLAAKTSCCSGIRLCSDHRGGRGTKAPRDSVHRDHVLTVCWSLGGCSIERRHAAAASSEISVLLPAFMMTGPWPRFRRAYTCALEIL